MKIPRLLIQSGQLFCILFSLIMITPVEAGLWDEVKQQADKVNSSFEALSNSLNHTTEGAGKNPQQVQKKQGYSHVSSNMAEAPKDTGTPAKSPKPGPSGGGAADLEPLKYKTTNGLPQFLLRPGGTNKQLWSEYLEFSRLLDYLALGAVPNVADRLSDQSLCSIAGKHLAASIRGKYVGPFGPRGCSWAGKNEFEQKRSREAFLSQEFPKILADARRTTLPLDVAVIQNFNLGNYDFSNKSFSLYIPEIDGLLNRWVGPVGGDPVTGSRGQEMRLELAPMITPKALAVSESEAQQLLEGPFAKSRTGKAVAVIELTRLEVDPKLQHYFARFEGRAKRIELYPEQQGTQGQPVYVFTGLQLVDQTRIDQANKARQDAAAAAAESRKQEELATQEAARLAELPRIELADTRYLITAHAAMIAKGSIPRDSSADLASSLKKLTFSKDPFENAAQQDKEKSVLTESLESFDVANPVWFAGKAYFTGYDFDNQMFSLSMDLHGSHTEGYPRLHPARAIGPLVLFFRLPSTPDDARRLSEYLGGKTSGTLDVRVLATPFSTSSDIALQSKVLNGGGRGWTGPAEPKVVFQANKLEFLRPTDPPSKEDDLVLDSERIILTYEPPGPWEPVKK